MSEKVLLTPDDVEKEGIPKSTQAKGRMTGNFCPHIKRGRSVYYHRTDFENWLASLRRRSTSDTTGHQDAQVTANMRPKALDASISPATPLQPRRRGRRPKLLRPVEGAEP